MGNDIDSESLLDPQDRGFDNSLIYNQEDNEDTGEESSYVELLIETVRRRKLLYDASNKLNKDAKRKELEWLAVAKETGKEGN